MLSDLTVCLVSYNSGTLIETCLKALGPVGGVVIVDNASTDGSPDYLAEALPHARIIRNTQNVGYGRAMNQAMASVATPYALQINPDAVMSPETLADLKAALEAGGDTAMIAAPLLQTPRHGFDLKVMGPNDRQAKILDPIPDGTFCTWFVTGAVWMIRTKAWQDVGGFDEKIFLYGEDMDLCKAATGKGYAILVVPGARGEHNVSTSTAPTLRIRWRKEWNIVWSHLYVVRKHDGGHAARRETWRLIRKHGPKTLFYALVFDKKRFLRDLAVTHAAVSYMFGKRPAARS